MAVMVSPVEGYVSSLYGKRGNSTHLGLDIATNRKPGRVVAMFAGKVIRIVRGRGRGNTSRTNELAPFRTGDGALVENPDGEVQLYGHVDIDDRWKVGMKIAAGDYLGLTNLSGNTSGYHLHLEMWSASGRTRNPLVDFRYFKVDPGSKPKRMDLSPWPKAPKPPATGGGSTATRKWQERQNRYGRAGLFLDGKKGTYSKRWEAWTKGAQKALNAFRGVNGLVVADGDYGPGFHAQVRIVQERNGLPTTGVIDASMIRWMRKKGASIADRPKTRP